MDYGTEVFRQHFKDFTDQYVLIGGTACDIAKSFWQFIEEGGHQARQRSNGQPEFYRFVKPREVGYPTMLELFARTESQVKFGYTGHLVPLYINDEVSSLSAILLNDSYYDFLLDGRTTSEGISVLDAAHLIPMKMKAWIDLTERRKQGIHVNDRDLRKHRQDVFRLFPLISGDEEIVVPTEVHEDIQSFIETVETLPFEPSNIGIKADKNEILDVYRTIYMMKE